jgi:HD-GYP domain-containing protein (c-di-GMP phosphodiesterase class II)
LDGSGYPRSLSGKDILLEAKIIAVADVVEAISSHRPYRPALGINVAIDELRRFRGVYFDAQVVDACLQIIDVEGFAFVA